MLRTTDPAAFAVLRGSACRLPEQAPLVGELERAIEKLQTAHPGILVESPAHVLVSSAAGRRPSRACRAHVCTSQLQGRALLRLGGGVAVGAAALALAHAAAQEEGMIALLRLVCEACGTYQTRLTGVPDAYRVKPLVSVRAIADFAMRNPSLRGSRRLADVLRYAADGFASARETQNALVLGMPMMHGGLGLGIPRMNYEVKASPTARALTGKSSFRCDLCWPEAKLDVEYQSRKCHEGEEMRISDSRRTNALLSMGWTVIGITNDELNSVVATDAIAETIRRHLGKRTPVRVSHYHERKLKLRRQLGLPIGYDDLWCT